MRRLWEDKRRDKIVVQRNMRRANDRHFLVKENNFVELRKEKELKKSNEKKTKPQLRCEK